MKLKKCCRCKLEKPLDDFYKLSYSKDGHRGHCKDCERKGKGWKTKGKPRVDRYKDAPVGTKQCAHCEQFKALSDFGLDNRSTDKLYSFCKTCRDEKQLKSIAKQMSSTSVVALNHYRAMKTMFHKYGITELELQDKLNEQKGLCIICDDDFGTSLITGTRTHGRQYCVDHDHKTGRIRGLLCNWCNTTLGYIEKKKMDPQRYMEYLGNY
jgi:hypothetical protein